LNSPELALHHQRLGIRAAGLRERISHIETSLSENPDAVRIVAALEAARAERAELDGRLRASELEVETHRARLRKRERELMSGRLSNPTELMKLSGEVEGIKAALGREEDLELDLMERQERLEGVAGGLERELESTRARAESEAPSLRARLEAGRAELVKVDAERAATWDRLPADWRQAYERVESRNHNPIAEAVDGQCQACRVTMTSSGRQALRRGLLVACDNCGRLLVMA
jgi:predicted  nucleic acid-binding Zn-ribbon protein